MTEQHNKFTYYENTCQAQGLCHYIITVILCNQCLSTWYSGITSWFPCKVSRI